MGSREKSNAETAETPAVRNAERLKFFTDAVVAIAMTLLILPLLESIAEASTAHSTPHQWLTAHGGQLFSFALSFVIIASFWRSHHALFEGIGGFTPILMWLNLAWMLGIVWLPVPTAMVGSKMRTDVTVVLLYVGTMLATSLLTLAMTVHLRSHPELVEPGAAGRGHRISDAAATSILFAVALVVAVVLAKTSPAPSPADGNPAGHAYYALLVLLLTTPLEALLHQRFTRRRRPTARKA
jgi:uncharacterized membrane protein